MLGHEDLIGGVDHTGLYGAPLDLGHAVEAGSQHHHQCGTHRCDHYGATTSLDTIQGNDHELPQWGLEEEGQDQKHLAKDRSVE